MLIDSSHRTWLFATVTAGVLAVAAYLLVDRFTPGGLTGGDTVGLWYGVAGSALMLYAGALAAHRKLPVRTWVGSRAFWLKGHLWLGSLSLVFILCHAGFRAGGPLELALWVALAVVFVTGVIGLALQHILPRTMAQRVPREAPYDQIPHLLRGLRRRADALVDAVAAVASQPEDEKPVAALKGEYDHDLRPYLQCPPKGRKYAAPAAARALFAAARRDLFVREEGDAEAAAQRRLKKLRDRAAGDTGKELRTFAEGVEKKLGDLLGGDADKLAVTAQETFAKLRSLARPARVEDEVGLLERICLDCWLRELEVIVTERRGYELQERLQWWLHAWLWLHVPASASLLVLGVAHAVTALYY